MKRLAIIISLVLFGTGVFAQIPEANQKIRDYVTSVIGTRVDRGECWDLAHNALELVGAKWDHQYVFGKEVNPEKDSIYPGDIIHFSNVTIRSKEGNTITTQSFPQHTAIIYEVLGKGVYRIAHQNTGFSGRKVGLSVLVLADRKSGKIRIYRPVI